MIYQSLSRLRSCRGIIATILVIFIASGMLNACSIFPGASTTKKSESTPTAVVGPRRNLRFAIITDGQASDPFWSVVKNGADQAARDMGVKVTYQAPILFSITTMSQLIDATVATQPDGLVVSIPDCAGLSPAIKRAQLVDIPVISINSGSNCASQLGLLNHIGQTGYEAGLASGQKLVAAGARHVLCMNQDVTNSDLNDRCRGINDALKKAHGKSEVLPVDLTNPTATQEQIQTTLTRDTSINAVITLSPAGAIIAIAALQQLGRQGQVMLATFDLSSTVLQAIQQGTMLFAVDQQQYLQGYLPIVLLTLYKTSANTVTNPIITTGPSFVTKVNVSQVQQLMGAGEH